jgi:hypothetical protein
MPRQAVIGTFEAIKLLLLFHSCKLFQKKLLFTSPLRTFAAFISHLHIGTHAKVPSHLVQYDLAYINDLKYKKDNEFLFY